MSGLPRRAFAYLTLGLAHVAVGLGLPMPARAEPPPPRGGCRPAAPLSRREAQAWHALCRSLAAPDPRRSS